MSLTQQKGSIMDDEKLIANLRIKHPSLVTQSMFMADAANRIEALGNACKEWAEVSQSNYQRAKAAEARVQTLLQQSAEHTETVAALIDQVKELEEVEKKAVLIEVSPAALAGRWK